MRNAGFSAILFCAILAGCSHQQPASGNAGQPAVPAYHVDPATASAISGTIHFSGKRPAPKKIDMSNDPACVEAHHGKAFDESLLVSQKGELANAFIYIKSGLDGKHFEPPASKIVIEQSGCWFKPRVLGIQTSQVLQIVNADQVTHNIHPMAAINREWNHSQGPGDPPLDRRFIKPEMMIPVKCNIHSWMHAYIGVLDHPYFAVSAEDGSFTIPNLPPGDYTIAVWHETLGTEEQQIKIAPHDKVQLNFTFKGN